MKGYSIHIGLNKVSQTHYLKLSDLRGAVNDAKDMHQIATQIFGYKSLGVFTDKSATTSNIISAFREAESICENGDILFISYSGHGGVLDDIPAIGKEMDELVDQTWCLYDRQLIDDEIFLEFSKFRKNVRILVVSDSCHSGSVTREVLMRGEQKKEKVVKELGMSFDSFLTSNNYRSKKLDLAKAGEILSKNKSQYEDIQRAMPVLPDKDSLNASVLLLAACQDEEVTMDGVLNGRFTSALKEVIKEGKAQFFNRPKDIIDQIAQYYSYPNPNFLPYGKSSKFLTQGNPFFIIPQEDHTIELNSKEIQIIPEQKQINTQTEIAVFGNHISISTPGRNIDFDLLKTLHPERFRHVEFDAKNKENCIISNFQDINIWDTIHSIARNADELDIELEIEPTNIENFPIEDEFKLKAPGDETGLMVYWPPFEDPSDIDKNWHLGKDHSQLSLARESVREQILNGMITDRVRIGHLDTGWDPNHPLLRENNNIRVDLAKSFVKGEEKSNKLAEDYIKKGGENQGHGTGTLGLISGGNIVHDGTNYGQLGAAPFVEVVPIRVTDSVIILNNRNIVKGLEYAIEIGCDVITMSLGGKPSKRMAKVINQAYDKGIIIVSAAGNSMVKGLAAVGPRKLVFPAKFDRVIAACGACFNHLPYDFNAQKELSSLKGSTRFMQGNWGPKKSMKTALTAYTPNVPWLVSRKGIDFVLSGGGTSSATPQIASAVALWLLKNKKDLDSKNYSGTWKQVEAVRNALYMTSKQPFENSLKFYGKGIIQVNKALEKKLEDLPELTRSPKAKSSLFGLIETIGLFVSRRRTVLKLGDNEKESLQAELYQIIDELNIEKLNNLAYADELEYGDIDIISRYKEEILEQGISQRLSEVIGL